MKKYLQVLLKQIPTIEILFLASSLIIYLANNLN